MKRNRLTLGIGLVLVLIFIGMLICFQVRQTEIALVTSFGSPIRSINVDPNHPEPGLKFKLPWHRVQIFDKRVQGFEGRGDKFEETLTQDHLSLMVRVYAGWQISNPALFRERFNGSMERAQSELESLVRNAKNTVVGNHPFSSFISPDEKKVRIPEIEQQILASIQGPATNNYGIDVRFLGIERLGLPQSITQKVFDRMKEERQREVQRLQAEGDARARNIRTAANRDATNTISKAEAKVIEIRGQAEAEADRALKVFEQNPELAIFLLKINALEESSRGRPPTLILNQRTPIYDMIDAAPKGAPLNPPNKK